jgi:dephospho-CoA kinase
MLNFSLSGKMIRVGITGNIGSGKSTVSRIFQAMGIAVFYADTEARQLYFREDVKEILRNIFGEVVFTDSGEMDTKKLAEIIFNDKSKLQTINGIIHPLVFERYREWLASHEDDVYTLHESAILFENKLEHHYDLIINVTAPPELRISRIMQRDGVGREMVEARMAHQWSEAEKNRRSDFVITNDGKQLLIPQVLTIDEKIKNKKGPFTGKERK